MQKLKLVKKYSTYPEYKNSGDEWLGKIPVGWQKERFKYIASCEKGKIPRELSATELPGYIPYLSMEYLRNGSEKPVNFALSKENICAENGDTILLWDGSNAGEFMLATDGVVSSTASVIKFKQVINKKFGYYFSKGFEKYLKDQTVGMGIPHVSGELISNRHYLLPPLVEQVKIVRFMDDMIARVDDGIQKKKRMVELLVEKRTAVINNVITQGLGSKALLVDSGIDWIGKIPEKWEVKRLKFLGEAIIGLTYSPEEVVNEGGTLVLRSSNIQRGRIQLHNNVYVKKVIPKKLITKKGDILICSRNGSRSLIGKNAIIDEHSEGLTFGAFMTVFRSKNYKFISWFLKSNLFMSQLSTTLTSTINQLTTQYLNNIVIIVPPVDEQVKITNFLEKKLVNYDKAIDEVEKSVKLLEEFKSSLISNVVTGKIKV